jgi:hypothetical protein
VEEFANNWLFFSISDIFFESAVTVHFGRVYKDDGSGFLLLYQYIFFEFAVSIHCGKICKDDSYGFLLLYQHILWMSGYRTLWKDLQRKTTATVSYSLSTYSIIWMSGYRTLWKDLQRRQLRFSSSLSTYSLDDREQYTVKRFAKTTAMVFFFVIHIFFG